MDLLIKKAHGHKNTDRRYPARCLCQRRLLVPQKKAATLKDERSVTRLAEEVFPPALVGAAQHAHDLAAGMESERSRRPQELEPGFLGQAIALLVVAAVAAGDEVVPIGVTAPRARNDMV